MPAASAIRLRPLKDWHLVRRIAFLRDPELARLMGWSQAEQRMNASELRFWRDSRVEAGDTLLAIEVGDHYAGDIDVVIYPSQGLAELTLMLGGRQFRRRGVGTEVVRRVLGWLFRGDELLVETTTAPPGQRGQDPGPKPQPPPAGHPYDTVEVVVPKGNAGARAFWIKQGFVLREVGFDDSERFVLGRGQWVAAQAGSRGGPLPS